MNQQQMVAEYEARTGDGAWLASTLEIINQAIEGSKKCSNLDGIKDKPTTPHGNISQNVKATR